MEIINKIFCLLGKHEFTTKADDYKYNIKKCNVCGKYEVYYKGLGLLYKCNYDQLPKAYKNI